MTALQLSYDLSPASHFSDGGGDGGGQGEGGGGGDGVPPERGDDAPQERGGGGVARERGGGGGVAGEHGGDDAPPERGDGGHGVLGHEQHEHVVRRVQPGGASGQHGPVCSVHVCKCACARV